MALQIPKLEDTIERLACFTYQRFLMNGSWINGANITSHGSIANIAESIFNISNADWCKTEMFNKNYEIIINNRESWNNGLDLNSVHLYSDGSKRNGRTASGWFSETLKWEGNLRLDDHSTIMQAELIAIEECATRCLHSITIMVDS